MDLNRRQLLVVTAATAVTCACGGADAVAADDAKSKGPLDAGPAGDYAADGAFDKFAKSDDVILIRDGDALAAFSATCTHKACTLRTREKVAYCNCHKSSFDTKGAPVAGSKATKPLPRYAIALSAERRVSVDKARTITDANDPAASVKLT